jgi:hypothetical protein
MAWAKDSDRYDPALGGYAWNKIRQYWRRQQRPCWRCGQPIDYTVKWPHPRSLVVGHITSLAQARAAGWSEAQINSIASTAPEHADCSNKSGAALGRRLQRQTPTRIVADRW